MVDVATTDDEDSGLRLIVRANDARGFGVFGITTVTVVTAADGGCRESPKLAAAVKSVEFLHGMIGKTDDNRTDPNYDAYCYRIKIVIRIEIIVSCQHHGRSSAE